MLSPAEVTHIILVLTDGAVRSALPFGPAFRGYASLSKAVVVAKTASVPAAVNAGPTEGGAALVQGHDSHGHCGAHRRLRVRKRTQGKRERI